MTNGRRNCIKEIMGWEKYGSESMLRVKLREPYEAAIYTGFDGSGTFPPEPAVRVLTDRMFTLKDLFRVVSDHRFADENGLGPGDVRMLKAALHALGDQGGGGYCSSGKGRGDTRKHAPRVVIIAPGM
jgi:hypothetical protein